jgi:phosphate transport system permease protein
MMVTMNIKYIESKISKFPSMGSLKIKYENTKLDFKEFLSGDIKLDIPELFSLGSCLVVLLTFLIFVGYIFYTAMPVFQKEGLINFIFGTEWNYDTNVYGIRIYIIGTLILTLVTLILAVPVSLFTAIFLSEFAPVKVAYVVRTMIELLVGIPSVVYGVFGLRVLRGVFRDYLDPFLNSISSFLPFFHDFTSGTGYGVLLASTVLAIMILPTITSLSEYAMRSVPSEYRDASVSLGATDWETIWKVVLPASRNGITSAIILGTMRAVGETMAVVMLIGNTAFIPKSILDTGYPMTAKILNDIGDYISTPDSRSALFGIAAVLFIVEIFFVGIARVVGGKK